MALTKIKVNEVDTKATPVLADSVLLSDSEDDGRGKLATLTALQALIGGGAVDSVAGKTGVVTLDADDVSETATKLWFTDTERAKLTGLGVAFEPSGIDDTIAMQAAIDAGGIVQLGAGTYIVSSVDVSNDVIIQGVGNETIIKRKDGTITSQTIEADARLFGIDTDDIRVVFRDLTIDENEANQNAYAAYGYAIATDLESDPVDGIWVSVDNVEFRNISCVGVEISSSYDATVPIYVRITNSRFLSARVGLAAGDVNVDSASGFGAYYISLQSNSQAHIENNRFIFDPAGLDDTEFAPCAIRITDGTASATGSKATISGNYFRGCGRGMRYNSVPTLLSPLNDLGVIDLYNFGKQVVVSGNQFVDSQGVPIRGKTNADQTIVSNNIISNAGPNAGISFGSATLAEQKGNLSITGNIIRDVGTSGITISGAGSGHSTTKIVNIYIADNLIDNVDTVNISGTDRSEGVRIAYSDRITISNNRIRNVDLYGIILSTACANIYISGNDVSSADIGIDAYAGHTGHMTVVNNTVYAKNEVIKLYNTKKNKLILSNNRVTNTYDYPVWINNFGESVISGNVNTSSTTSFLRLLNITDTLHISDNVSTGSVPIYSTTSTGILSQLNNSWNQRISYGTAAPVAGTYKVGDIFYNTAPAAGGWTGWICTAAGTPGTWKGFGVIES